MVKLLHELEAWILWYCSVIFEFSIQCIVHEPSTAADKIQVFASCGDRISEDFRSQELMPALDFHEGKEISPNHLSKTTCSL